MSLMPAPPPAADPPMSHTPSRSPVPESGAGLRGDIMGGLTAMLVSLPMILSCGAVVYQPLGGGFVAAGVVAAFLTAIVGALVPAVLGGRLHVNAPRATQAALLAAMVAELATRPEFRGFLPADGATAAAVLMVTAAAALAVAGLTQMALGAFRLGDLVKYVPQTVVAGFVAGFVIQIVAIQTPFLFGLDGWSALRHALWNGQGAINGYSLGLAVLAGAVTLVTPRLTRVVPGALVGLVVGTVTDVLVGHWYPGLTRGPLIGALPGGLLPGLPGVGLEAVLRADFPASALYAIVSTGVTLAFITSIQSLLSATAGDSLFGSSANSNRELANQGACNLMSALAGGTASGGSPLLTRAAYQQGGRGRRVNLVLGLGLITLAWGLRDPVGAIPLSVLAAVVIVVTAQGLDDWTRHLLATAIRRLPGRDLSGRDLSRLGTDLAVLALVSGLVAFVNVPAAIGIGMLVTVLVFLRRSSSSSVRRIYHGDVLQSNTVRSNIDVATLEQHGHATAIIELQGPLFFGSTDFLSRSIKDVAGGVTCVILDFRRVIDIDSTSVLILERVDGALAGHGCRLLLAGLAKASEFRRFLLEVGFDGPEQEGRVFAELDAALAHAEDRLLADRGVVSRDEPEMPLAGHPALAGLNPARLSVIQILARRLEYAPGEAIFREGEPAEAVFLLVRGAATRQSRGHHHPIRQTGYRAGALFGESALFRGGLRTAEVVADTPVVCYRLVVEDLLMVDGIDPWIALTVVRNIAAGLMDRKRFLRRVQGARARP